MSVQRIFVLFKRLRFDIFLKNDCHIARANQDFEEIRRHNNVKSLKITILGAPNAGKSTLINELVQRKMCGASSKAHTTQKKTTSIYSVEDTQLIFLDTPGIVRDNEFKKFKLFDSFKNDPEKSLYEADIVGLLHDAGNRYTRHKIHDGALKLLRKVPDTVSTILILNKVDQIKDKQVLLDLAKSLTNEENWPNFKDVFMISALNSDGVDDLRTYFLDCAKNQEWFYEESKFTDREPKDVIEEIVRSKLLDALSQEIPYSLHVTLEHYDVRSDESLSVVVRIQCPNKRICKHVLGYKGKRIKHIATESEQQLQHAFRQTVKLKLNVQVQ